jgi:hypothetical protein
MRTQEQYKAIVTILQEKDYHMNELELRGWLAAHLKGDSVPVSLWNVLKAHGLVDAALKHRDGRQKLVQYARALLPYGEIAEQVDSVPGQTAVRPVAESPQFSGYEEERAETFAEYLKLRGTAYPGVIEFRKSCWGQARPMVPESAYRIVEQEDLRKAFTWTPRSMDPDNVKPSGQLEYFSRTSGEPQHIDFYEGSYFERVQKLSDELRKNFFPRWSEAEAAWFVLTGEVTVPKALTARIDSFVGDQLTNGTITLTV